MSEQKPSNEELEFAANLAGLSSYLKGLKRTPEQLECLLVAVIEETRSNHVDHHVGLQRQRYATLRVAEKLAIADKLDARPAVLIGKK